MLDAQGAAICATDTAQPLELLPMGDRSRDDAAAQLRHVASVSGGKDSTALYLALLERGIEFDPVFADTGHEHQWTLDFVATLHERTGGPKVRVVRADLTDRFERKRETIRTGWPAEGVPDHVVSRALDACKPTGNPFLDACLLHAGFPSARARFCTRVLKRVPIEQEVVVPLLRDGCSIASWQGVRADESVARRDLDAWQQLQRPPHCRDVAGHVYAYRPILRWTIRDVFRQHRRHGIEPNPLYAAGGRRVGCMPCIMAGKQDIRVVADRHPAEIERIAEWERIVGLASKTLHGKATFFDTGRTNKTARDASEGNGIYDAVEWSRTTRGGKNFDLIPLSPVLNDLNTACDEWGACE